MSQFFALGGQSIGVSASASVLQDWFPLGWTGWISAVQGTLKSLLQYHSSKASILQHSSFFIIKLSHPYMTIGKTTAFTWWIFVRKVTSLLFNMLSRFVIAFLSRSKSLKISWLQSQSAVILEPQKINLCFHCFPIYLPWSDGTGCHDLSFRNVVLSQLFFTLCLYWSIILSFAAHYHLLPSFIISCSLLWLICFLAGAFSEIFLLVGNVGVSFWLLTYLQGSFIHPDNWMLSWVAMEFSSCSPLLSDICRC